MKIIATLSNPEKVAVILDTDANREHCIPTRTSFFDDCVVGRASCRPFGITWDEGALYIVNNSQLIYFDSSFRFKRQEDRLLHTNCHQAVARGGLLWIASPWTNSILQVCPTSAQFVQELNPLTGEISKSRNHDRNLNADIYHFNSLLWVRNRLFIAAHAFGPKSFILEIDGRSFRIVRRVEKVGSMIHGIGYHDGELIWLSSGTGEIRSSFGLRHPLSRNGFARGLSVTEDTFVVGISERRSRGARCSGNSWIQLIDRQTLELKEEFLIEDSGSLNDLRVIDIFDYAHWQDPLITRQSEGEHR